MSPTGTRGLGVGGLVEALERIARGVCAFDGSYASCDEAAANDLETEYVEHCDVCIARAALIAWRARPSELDPVTVEACAKLVDEDAAVHWKHAEEAEQDDLGDVEDGELSEAVAMGLEHLGKRIRALSPTTGTGIPELHAYRTPSGES